MKPGLACALLLALCACASPVPGAAATAPPPPPPVVSAPELGFWELREPAIADGQRLHVAGLYRRLDTTNRFLDVCQIPSAPSADGAYRQLVDRFPLSQELPAGGPALVQVEGVWRGGRLGLIDWQVRAAPTEELTMACRAFFHAHAAMLADLDWGDLARPGYTRSSSRFSLAAGDLDSAEADLQGYDAASDRAIVRFGGPEMPAQVPQVRRSAVLYCVVQVTAPHTALYAVTTIEGWVEE